jgi:uncharacterized Zn finger protein
MMNYIASKGFKRGMSVGDILINSRVNEDNHYFKKSMAILDKDPNYVIPYKKHANSVVTQTLKANNKEFKEEMIKMEKRKMKIKLDMYLSRQYNEEKRRSSMKSK